MINTRLYLAIGLPTLSVLASLVVSLIALHNLQAHVDKRFDDLKDWIRSIEGRVGKIEDRLEHPNQMTDA